MLRCNASGIPEPDISWRKEHGGLDKKRFRQLSNGYLHIRDVHMSDAGGYFCVAITSDELKEIKATVRVVGMMHRFVNIRASCYLKKSNRYYLVKRLNESSKA